MDDTAKGSLTQLSKPPCIMCVQYRGGYHDACGGCLEYRGDIMINVRYLEYHGGVQYHGGTQIKDFPPEY